MNKDTDSTYYIKKNGKYVPVGIAGPDLYEGIWLVQVKEHCRSSKNLVGRIRDLPNPFDMEILAKVTILEDIITDIFHEKWGDGKSCSFSEVAEAICNKLATEESKLKTHKFNIRKQL
jgi:hypothetical protein